MNRRDLMKGILALPVAAAAAQTVSSEKTGYSGATAQKSAVLRVILEGPFAVVQQKYYGNRIRAFVPQGDNHVFFLNGNQQNGSYFHLKLGQDGLVPSSSSSIDPGFNDFKAPAPRWVMEDYYFTIDLPCPRKIWWDQSLQAVFASDPSHQVTMPTNHILEYDVSDISKVMLYSTESGTTIPRICKRTSGTDCYEFWIEVGLPFPKVANPPDPDPKAQKAKAFFNKPMLDCFPDLKKSKKIKKIIVDGARPATDVECKNGGLIVLFPQ